MKSRPDKFTNSDEALEMMLRESPPRTAVPGTLHNSIMGAINAAKNEDRISVSGFARFWRFLQNRWMPVSGLAGIILLGLLLAFHNRSETRNRNSQALTQISAAFSASQEAVNALPSVTVGPLSDELDKVNRDLDRTAEFLLATLP
jgi:hypothetical protein